MNSTSSSIGAPIEGRRQHGWMFWTAAICGLLVWTTLVALYRWKFGDSLSGKRDEWGQFGDYVGGVLNPIFGFAGFLILGVRPGNGARILLDGYSHLLIRHEKTLDQAFEHLGEVSAGRDRAQLMCS